MIFPKYLKAFNIDVLNGGFRIKRKAADFRGSFFLMLYGTAWYRCHAEWPEEDRPRGRTMIMMKRLPGMGGLNMAWSFCKKSSWLRRLVMFQHYDFLVFASLLAFSALRENRATSGFIAARMGANVIIAYRCWHIQGEFAHYCQTLWENESKEALRFIFSLLRWYCKCFVSSPGPAANALLRASFIG